MSLHDIDKGSMDRGAPTPNTHDSLADGSVAAHQTVSTHYKTDADTSHGRIQLKNKIIQVNDETNIRMLIGLLPDGTYGIAISKPGIDVTTAFS